MNVSTNSWLMNFISKRERKTWIFTALFILLLYLLFSLSLRSPINGIRQNIKETQIENNKIIQDKVNIERAKEPISRGSVDRERVGEVYEITVYNDYGKTASGTTTTNRRTVAVDTSVLPFGTQVEIEGMGTYTAEDTGGAVKGKVIDVYMNVSNKEALSFGRQKRKVKIL